LLFPREAALGELLEVINREELKHIWAEDEAIGWIYQYFNSSEERKAMRKASAAPRNSRELAVRNQFFTPRYVVEFLTDNTLGRIWYEMRQGKTALKESCRYLVRRPDEVFLNISEGPVLDWLTGVEGAAEPMVHEIAHSVNGYPRTGNLHEGAEDLLNEKVLKLQEGNIASLKTQELLDFLFILHSADRFSEGLIEKHKAEVGRILAELRRRREKAAKEDLSQEEMLNLPVFIPLRDKKDPRDLKILDPACGSGHFLLYAFDLLETIYEEAWQDENSSLSDPTGRSLREDFESLDELRTAIPELILRWNLHGIDIDPRAVQIAALALWLRAQRSWQRLGIRSAKRPRLTKSNIVCAEPMPGDENLLKEFTDVLKPKVLGQLVEVIFDKMKLAGEAGSLLKIEEEIKEAVAEARKQWEAKPKPEQAGLFPELEKPKHKQKELQFDVRDIDDLKFWDRAETLILQALQKYAEKAENGLENRRRMFAEDAVQGFAFIDLCRKRFDVVLMNPPFGDATTKLYPLIKHKYPKTYSNLGTVFVDCLSTKLGDTGELGIIIDVATSVRSSYAHYRRDVLYSNFNIKSYLHLGWDVLDANVEVCCFTASKILLKDDSVLCIDLKTDYKKNQILLNNIVNFTIGNVDNKHSYFAKQVEFERFPNGVPNFTLPAVLRRLFITYDQLDGNYALVKTGLSSGNNSRFYKLLWECPNNAIGKAKRWVHLSNGGEFSPFYRKFEEAIDWKNGGEIVKNNKGAYIRNEKLYFSAGLSYGKRCNFLSIHTHPLDRIITNEGQGIFPIEEKHFLPLLGILNTPIPRVLINEYCGQHKENGYVSLIPIPHIDTHTEKQLSTAVSYILNTIRKWCSYELENAEFVSTINTPLTFGVKSNQSELKKIKEEIDNAESLIIDISSHLYQIDIKSSDYVQEKIENCQSIYEAHFKRYESNKYVSILIINQIVGHVFGRWDIRFAIGEKSSPNLSDHFDPLLPSPPGMLQSIEGLPAEPKDVPESYPLQIRWNGILVDDESSEDDIVTGARETIEIIWNEEAENKEQEICKLIGVDSLKEYFENPNKFFSDHLQIYSKGRRKAPIYWPLSTESGLYTLWLYYHRLTDQTLFTCVTDYVNPKIETTVKDIERLQKDLSEAGNAKKRAELEKLQDFRQELIDFREELLRVAKLPYKPNLNDGVLITASPLWKLFRYKPWQKDLKACWEKLEAGKYDWAHLAYSIWPDRVREKCKTDRSIAIAHDLEEICEVQPKKTSRGRKKGYVQ